MQDQTATSTLGKRAAMSNLKSVTNGKLTYSAASCQTSAKLGNEWFSAWNDHDVDKILEHYAEDVEFTSPFVSKVMKVGSGTIKGKQKLREYFSVALTKYTDLRFQNLKVLPGQDSFVLCYESINDLDAAETMILNKSGKVCKVFAHYTPKTKDSL